MGEKAERVGEGRLCVSLLFLAKNARASEETLLLLVVLVVCSAGG